MFIDQQDNDKKPTSKSDKLLVLVVSITLFILFSLEVFTNYEPKKLSAFLFFIFWVPLLFIHELGHAVMAKILGWKIKKVVLGIGKVMTIGHLFNAPVEFRSMPIEGFVQIAPKSTSFVRLKHALIYFAGPGIEILIFLLITAWMGGFTELLRIDNDYSRIALQSFAFAAIAGAVINLVPMGIITKDGNSPNDGMGILLCLFSSTADYKKWIKDDLDEDKRNTEF